MFANKAMYNCSYIARTLGISKKFANKLKQRIRRNYTLKPKKRGKKRLVSEEMINFLKEWFKKGDNGGKTFKYAYNALVEKFGLDKVKVSVHGCYKAFRRYTNYSYKRVQRVKVKSNTNENKEKRVQYL